MNQVEKELFLKDYRAELADILSKKLAGLSLSRDRIEAIVDNSAKFIDVDELPYLSEGGDGEMQTESWKRNWCIIKHVALGAAILAAWVASGGLLTIGSSIAGVTISSELYAALVGGASARVIAEILCGK